MRDLEVLLFVHRGYMADLARTHWLFELLLPLCGSQPTSLRPFRPLTHVINEAFSSTQLLPLAGCPFFFFSLFGNVLCKPERKFQ